MSKVVCVSLPTYTGVSVVVLLRRHRQKLGNPEIGQFPFNSELCIFKIWMIIGSKLIFTQHIF
jgi:hypothetical protein